MGNFMTFFNNPSTLPEVREEKERKKKYKKSQLDVPDNTPSPYAFGLPRQISSDVFFYKNSPLKDDEVAVGTKKKKGKTSKKKVKKRVNKTHNKKGCKK